MRNKKYLIILLTTLLLSFAVIPLRSFTNLDFALSTFVRGVLFWCLTVYFLNKYGSAIKAYKIILLVLLADLLPDITVRLFMGHFVRMLPSFPDSILQVIVVLLGWCYTWLNRTKKIILAIANLLLCAWVSYYGFSLWNDLDFVKNSQFKKIEIAELLKQADSQLSQDSLMRYCQDKNIIVYIGGDESETNIAGISFMKKVHSELKESKDVAILAIICTEESNEETLAKISQMGNDSQFPVVYINTQFRKNALYNWFLIDKKDEIKCRDKINTEKYNDKSDESKNIHFFKEILQSLKGNE